MRLWASLDTAKQPFSSAAWSAAMSVIFDRDETPAFGFRDVVHRVRQSDGVLADVAIAILIIYGPRR
jgi:hypothetical protein